MKKPSDDLFRLISAMSRSEKRYFKVFASGGSGEKNYLRLFDAISKQKEYDEEAIVRQFKGDSLVRNLSYTKNYLYNLILKALRVYHSDISIAAQLFDMFRSIEILSEKGLFDQCWKILEKARSLIDEHHEYVMEFHLLGWQNSLFRKEMDLEGLNKHLEDEIELRAVEKYKNFLEYGRLSQQMFIAIRRNTAVRGPERMETFNLIMAGPLLQDERLAITFEAKAWFHDLHSLYAQVQSNVHEEFRHISNLIKLLEEHPERIAAAPHNYIAALVRFVELCIRLDHDDAFQGGLKKIRELGISLGKSLSSVERRRLELRANSRADNLQLSFFIANGCFKQGEEVVEKIKERLRETESLLDAPRKNDYWYNLSTFYFGLGHYDESLEWINRFINEHQKGLQQDLYSFARILSLIIHLELENVELFENAIRSLRRHLTSRDRLFQFEEAFLTFLRNIQSAVDRADEVSAYRSLLESVERLEDDPYEARVFRFFDVSSWLQSKIEESSFAEIIRERSRKEMRI